MLERVLKCALKTAFSEWNLNTAAPAAVDLWGSDLSENTFWYPIILALWFRQLFMKICHFLFVCLGRASLFRAAACWGSAMNSKACKRLTDSDECEARNWMCDDSGVTGVAVGCSTLSGPLTMVSVRWSTWTYCLVNGRRRRRGGGAAMCNPRKAQTSTATPLKPINDLEEFKSSPALLFF